jgi:hypothetical protein
MEPCGRKAGWGHGEPAWSMFSRQGFGGMLYFTVDSVLELWHRIASKSLQLLKYYASK